MVAERLFSTLKNKSFKHITSVSKNDHIAKLDEINKHNNTYHRAIKMMPLEINPSLYVNFDKENIKKSPRFHWGTCFIDRKHSRNN